MIKYTVSWYDSNNKFIDISLWLDDEKTAWKYCEKEELKQYFKKIIKWNINDENMKYCYPLCTIGYVTQDNLTKVRDLI